MIQRALYSCLTCSLLLAASVTPAVAASGKFPTRATVSVRFFPAAAQLDVRVELNRKPPGECRIIVRNVVSYDQENVAVTSVEKVADERTSERRTVLRAKGVYGVRDSDLGNPAILSVGGYVTCKKPRRGSRRFSFVAKGIYTQCTAPNDKLYTPERFLSEIKRRIEVVDED